MTRRHLAGLVAAVAAVLAAVTVTVASLAGHPRPTALTRPQPTTSGTTAASTTTTAPPSGASGRAGSWRPVAPATTVPADTPVQAHYDQGFERGFSSPANRAELAALADLPLPRPAVTGGWPALRPAETPGAWAAEWVTGLLSIDFATRTRADLAAWLVAESAPDLMPGVPLAARSATLVATVCDPGITGQPSPIPAPARWAVDARAHVRWSVTDLQVQLDPGWQAMIAAGWQPTDLRAGVEDVTGVLEAHHGRSVTRRRFSVVVQVGSAAWHPGYGTVLISAWSVAP